MCEITYGQNSINLTAAYCLNLQVQNMGYAEPQGRLRITRYVLEHMTTARSDAAAFNPAGTNCIKIGLPGKRILSKRKCLLEVLFS